MKKIILISLLFLLKNICTGVNVTVTNPSNTTPNLSASYATLNAALSALNSITAIAGPVTLTCTASGSETAPSGGYIISYTAVASSSNYITIDGNGSTLTASSAQVSGGRLDAVIKIVGSDYLTIKNFTIRENPLNATIALNSNNCTEFGIAVFYAGVTDGAQHDTLENNNISLRNTYRNSIGIYASSMHSSTDYSTNAPATATSGLNNDLKIFGNTISNACYGISVVSTPNSGSGTAILDEGVEIGGSSVSTGNTITYVDNDYEANAAWNGFLENSSGIHYRNGVNVSIQNNSVTSVARFNPTTGIMLSAATLPVSVTYTNVISRNTLTESVTMTPLYGISFGYGIATGALVCDSNVVHLSQTLNNNASYYYATGIIANFPSATKTCTGNAVVITQTQSLNAFAAATTAIDLSNSSTSLTANSNNITVNETSTGGGKITCDVICINASSAGANVTLLNNTILIDQNASGSSEMSTNIAVIAARSAATSLTIGSAGNGNTITIKNGITGSATYTLGVVYYIDLGSAAHGSVNISGNNFNTNGSSLRLTDNLSVISNGTATYGSCFINDNTVSIDKVSATGAVTFFNQASAANTCSWSGYSGNSITFGNLATVDDVIVLQDAGGQAVNPKNIVNNTISVTGTNTGNVTGINYGYGISSDVSGNSVIVSTASPSILGIGSTSNAVAASIHDNTLSLTSSSVSPVSMNGISVAGTNFQVANNTFSSLRFTAALTNAPASSGIAVTGGSGNIFKNIVTNIASGNSGAVSPLVNGILVSGGTAVNVYQNKIYGLSTLCTGSNTLVNGIRITGGTTNKIYNNIIGDLSAVSASSVDAIIGICIFSATVSSSNYVYYNTVRLTGSGGANFGSSGLYHAANATATTATLYLNNNIIVNNCTPSGSGIVAAYRRSSGAANMLNNYAAVSDNNLFYAGTPGASHLVYSDGTSSAQTLAAYKNGVFTAGTLAPRDAYACSDDVHFLSTTGADPQYLHIDPAFVTPVESGANVLAGYVTDYDDNARDATFPDIGADEFNGTGTPPDISFNPLFPSCSTGDRVLTGVSIYDWKGVLIPPSPLSPRVYYRKNSGTWFSSQGTETSGIDKNGTWTFTLSASDMGGLAGGDIISYYVIAQDNRGYVSSSPSAGLVATDVNTVVVPPSAPATTTIITALSGIYTIGAGGDWPTLTSALSVYNLGCVSGPVTFRLTDALYGAAETFPVVLNSVSTATNTLTITPATGVTVTLSGANATGPLLDLNGADYFTLDGLNSGGSSLTISNTATGTNSTIRLVADATHNTITNCTVLGSATVNNATGGGNIFLSTGTTTGNDYNTISSCRIGPAGSNLPSKGICSIGSTTSSTLCNSNNLVNNCEIYDFFLSSGCGGIMVGSGNTNWSFTNNKIYETAARTFTAGGSLNGILFSDATYGDNIQITGNTVGYASNSGTGTLTLLGSTQAGSFVGISMIASPSAATACNINSNTVSNVSLTSSGGPFYGIYNGTGAISNIINLNGNILRNLATTTTTNIQYGIFAGSAATLLADGNLITNISRNSLAALSGIEVRGCNSAVISNNEISFMSNTVASGTSIVYGISDDVNSKDYTISGNSIHDLSTASTSAFTLTGVIMAGLQAGNKVCTGNDVYNFSSPNTGIQQGLYFHTTSSPNPVDISSNKVHHFSGGNYADGIEYSASTPSSISKNRIYDLSAASATPTIYGILLTAGTTNNVSNNIIGDLKTPAANSANPLSGIYISGGTTNNLYYNTIWLNASSSGALFGSCGVYASTVPVVEMRDNILINLSTPKGAGYSCAYRRSAASLTNYTAASNNNIFYAGTPGTYHLILYNGSSYITLSDYKTLVGPTRDNASLSGNVTWLSTDGTLPGFLHPDPTYSCIADAAAATITGYTTDYDGNLRNATTPDIGADEFDPVTSLQWNGSVSSDWSNPQNWTPNYIPSPTTLVNIVLGYTFEPNANITGLSCGSLLIGPGTVVHVGNGSNLTVNGNVTLQSGAILDNDGDINVLGDFVF